MSLFQTVISIDTSLERLKTALSHLPDNIPLGNQRYNFEHFSPDPEKIELYGTSEAAINHELEVTFAKKGRRDDSAPCPFEFEECGPGLTAVVDVLRAVLHKDPNSLHHVYKIPAQKMVDVEPEVGDNIVEALTINHCDYVDVPEPVPKGKGGSISCHKKNDPKKVIIFRCVGTAKGYTTAWKCETHIKKHIFGHATICEHIPCPMKEELDGGLAADAPSAKVAHLQASKPKAVSSTPSVPSTTTKRTSMQPSVKQILKKACLDQQTNQLDADIVELFCVGGIPPSKVDLPQWKIMWWHTVPSYEPASASKLEEYLIPAEAGFVRTKQLEHLWSCNNLSMTLDGQTTRLPESVYTVHIITPICHIFLFEGNEASDESHTAEHILRSLMKKKVQKKYPWIINIPDPCHRMNLLIKDICTIPIFQPKSTFANSKLKQVRKKQEITRGLDVNDSFMPDMHESLEFQLLLSQLLAVTGPPAKATKCLESSFATAANVYAFWLALFKKNVIKLPVHVLEKIHRLSNYRFNQTINSAPSDTFIVAFFLIPHTYAAILKNINPLALTLIHIHHANLSASIMADDNVILQRIGNFLVSQLQVEYESKEYTIHGLDGNIALAKLNEQIIAYSKGAWPFNCPLTDDTNILKYWTGFLDHDNANILAFFGVKIFSITVNSMADECAASTITWLNSALCNRQKSTTLINQVQIRQWHLMTLENVCQISLSCSLLFLLLTE
ncbi:uncharacterized protein F5147DRAFT_744584 [Suillus discolor]|uniref:Uncharacterized protein n=1 Tax=Suillus discolor TaxID=1912936 RepID=A0A9P7FBH0_9AGAM|nr:uncharacterized protein F5147DRAFT_744584 [Suillus discolor]KAG2112346.1 hypothetical protein F5147DRAFT_744584 [Suillus discolor]